MRYFIFALFLTTIGMSPTLSAEDSKEKKTESTSETDAASGKLSQSYERLLKSIEAARASLKKSVSDKSTAAVETTQEKLKALIASGDEKIESTKKKIADGSKEISSDTKDSIANGLKGISDSLDSFVKSLED